MNLVNAIVKVSVPESCLNTKAVVVTKESVFIGICEPEVGPDQIPGQISLEDILYGRRFV